ncbi:ATP12 family chaperone protein [Tistrella mobilis]|uniref:ATP12 family chaperone protein n=1 Tax=Tistrella mobilis TaxID=171437 RepID=UPI0035579F29
MSDAVTRRKRFYKAAEAAPVAGDGAAPDPATPAGAGWTVLLDGRGLRTPAKAPLVVPGRALARLIADEWAAQETHIAPETMPATKLANVVIDRVVPHRAQIAAELAGYIGTDLVCYRADNPKELAALQARHWDPLVDWARTRYDIHLVTTTGLLAVDQPPATVERLTRAIEAADPWRLAVLHGAVTTAGSVVIGLALAEAGIDAATAYDAAFADEHFQIARWGEDAEQAERLALLRRDLDDLARIRDALNAG